MRVEVKSAEVREQSGTSKTSGKPYELREQAAWIDLGKAYPVEVKFLLQKGQQPFAVGHYDAGTDCFWVGRGSNLNFDLSRMKPAKVAAVPSAAAR
jgi:hypothetical protein